MKFNQLHPEPFKWRFKREHRVRSLEELHDIWLRAKARKNGYNKRFWEYLTECAQKVQPDVKGNWKSHKIYFYDPNNSLGYSTRTVEFKTREEKLNYWLMDDENLKMGNELYRLQRFTRGGTEYIAFEIFFEVLKKELHRINMVTPFKDKIIIVEVGGKKYFISIDDRIDIYSSYVSYKFIGEYNEKVISL